MPGNNIPGHDPNGFNGRAVRCILFDLGDTLWSRKDMSVWERMETAANLRAVALLRKFVPPTLLPAMNDVALGKRLREASDEQMRTMIRQDPGVEPHGAFAIAQVLQKLGFDGITSTQGAAIFEALRVRIPGSRPLFDDVLTTLDALQQRGFLLGVVTNRHWGGQLFQEDLHTLGLLNYFDPRHMAISADLGIRKPNPALFLHALNALDVAPEQAAMVGDSLRSDILGGKILNILTIWKPKPSLQAQVHAHLAASNPGGTTTSTNLTNPSPGLTSKNRPVVGTQAVPLDLPAGLHVTDDDYVLAQVQSRGGEWDEYIHGEITPDLTIKRLSDLLDLLETPSS